MCRSPNLGDSPKMENNAVFFFKYFQPAKQSLPLIFPGVATLFPDLWFSPKPQVSQVAPSLRLPSRLAALRQAAMGGAVASLAFPVPPKGRYAEARAGRGGGPRRGAVLGGLSLGVSKAGAKGRPPKEMKRPSSVFLMEPTCLFGWLIDFFCI